MNPWYVPFAGFTFLLLLLLASFPYLTPGSATYVVAIASLVVILVGLAASGLLVRSGWDPF